MSKVEFGLNAIGFVHKRTRILQWSAGSQGENREFPKKGPSHCAWGPVGSSGRVYGDEIPQKLKQKCEIM